MPTMRKFRILFAEVIGLGVLIGWLMWKYPDLVDDIIPWVALLVAWHLTWEFVLDTGVVRRGAAAFRKRVNRVWIWVLVFLIGGGVSVIYWIGIQKALTRLASLAAQRTAIKAAEQPKPQPPPPKPEVITLPETKQPTSAEIAADLAKKLMEEETERIQPLVKRGSPFAVQVPFTVYRDRWNTIISGVPMEANTEDPLFSTYNELAGASRVSWDPQYDQQTHQIIPADPKVTGADNQHFLARLLQYYSLRSIVDMGSPAMEIKLKDGRANATPTYSVIIPDEQEYPRDKLLKLLPLFKLPYVAGNWMWSGHTKWKLKVPKGTSISLPDQQDKLQDIYVLRLERKPDFTLDFQIKPSATNKGVLPDKFVPRADEGSVNDMYTYIFTVSMKFTWYRDHHLADPYSDWAQGLHEGLRKRLASPGPDNTTQP